MGKQVDRFKKLVESAKEWGPGSSIVVGLKDVKQLLEEITPPKDDTNNKERWLFNFLYNVCCTDKAIKSISAAHSDMTFNLNLYNGENINFKVEIY